MDGELGVQHAKRLEALLDDYREFRRHVVPLCAAETPISDYVRSFLSEAIHQSYAMGGPLAAAKDNFIGAEFVLGLHELTIELCREAFGVDYADPRPLSGTGAVTNLLMTLSEPGQRVMLQTSASGGHASMLPICRRLGLEVIDFPYDYDRFQIDVETITTMDLDRLDFVLFAPSDILYAPAFEQVEFDPRTTVIYDATQTLGLIATGHLQTPFMAHPRMVVCGGTHKTLPGPSCGLILTRNLEIAACIDAELSPKYVRHTHPHHVAALCATLIEHEAIGRRYSDRIITFSTGLARGLEELGLDVLQDGDRRTETHQVFVHINDANLEQVFERASEAGVTLNVKRKPLFRSTGIRLGVQEIARYRWDETALSELARLLADLFRPDQPVGNLRDRVRELAARNSFAEDLVVTPASFRRR